MLAVIKLSSPGTKEFWEIPVLYEDEHLLALDKPSGLLGSPDRYNPEKPNLLGLLHAGIKDGKRWATERNLSYLMNAHRLDPETSGIILLTKAKPVLVTLANLFGSEKPLKTYIALVRGSPKEDRFEVDAKLAPNPMRAGLIKVDPKQGKRAKTNFEVAERFGGFTLLKCEPLTERAHQIRAHLRWAGFPIVGDGMYGGKPLLLSRIKPVYRLKAGHEERPLISRVALHAQGLSFPHPITGSLITISSLWPKDISVAVKYLRKYASGSPTAEPDAPSSWG